MSVTMQLCRGHNFSMSVIQIYDHVSYKFPCSNMEKYVTDMVTSPTDA